MLNVRLGKIVDCAGKNEAIIEKAVQDFLTEAIWNCQ